jgi:hypothetical protein
MASRLTTREATSTLGCRQSETLALLKAAGIPHVRCGSSYLWDGPTVARLVATLSANRQTQSDEFRQKGGAE